MLSEYDITVLLIAIMTALTHVLMMTTMAIV